MVPKLYIFKRQRHRGKRKYTEFHFVVVDAEKEAPYPIGYVCTLPVDLKHSKRFLKFFGENKELALKLLRDALTEYGNDAEIKAEIERRIAILTAKPKPKPVNFGLGRKRKKAPKLREPHGALRFKPKHENRLGSYSVKLKDLVR